MLTEHGKMKSKQYRQNNSDVQKEKKCNNKAVRLKGSNFLTLLQNYIPNRLQFSFKNLCKLPEVKIKVYKDSGFFGQMMNGRKNGIGCYSMINQQGLIIYDDGHIYEGGLENDKKHGSGLEILQDGSIYDGQFVNGKPQGMGKYTWSNGETYNGQWFNGLKHGKGVWSGKTCDTYMGEWKSGNVDGYGVHVWVNGDRYEGEFENSLKHGTGLEFFKNGDNYSGKYFNGKPEGYGEYLWKNGNTFKGSFHDGLRNGLGRWIKSSNLSINEEYEGTYQNDKKSGLGIFKWENGDVYNGSFEDDSRHGYGEMNYSDGTSYKGMWNKGSQQQSENIVCRDYSGSIIDKKDSVKDLTEDDTSRKQIIVRHYSYHKSAKAQSQSQKGQTRPSTGNRIRQNLSVSNQFLDADTQINILTKTKNQMFRELCDEICLSKSNKSSQHSQFRSLRIDRVVPSSRGTTKSFRIQSSSTNQAADPRQYDNKYFF